MTLKRTPLTDLHESLGGRMVDFGGWLMPVQYPSGVVEEHLAVRNALGLFDVSHMGEVRVTGAEAERFLNVLTTNDVTKLSDGQAQYSVMATETGCVVDDLLVYRFNAEEYLLVINASTTEKDVAWIESRAESFDVVVVDESPLTGQIAIQGPRAQEVLQTLTDLDLSEIAYYHFKLGDVAGVRGIVSRTGYTGEDGFEVYMPADESAKIWQAMMEAGAEHGVKPAGLGARDTLRLEARMHLYGNDMDETTTLLEAGLGWVAKLKKETDFVGKAALKAQKKEGIQRKLVGFEMTGKGIARHGYDVVDASGAVIGAVTSGAMTPTLKKAVGLAYVPKELSKEGTELHIKIRNRVSTARVVKGAFYQRES